MGDVRLESLFLGGREVLCAGAEHPQIGAAIVERVRSLKACACGIRHHHERYDGSGYPDGLGGENIPLESRIIAIADAYSAMTSERSYSPALTVTAALGEIRRGSGSQFDPRLAKKFIQLVKGNAGDSLVPEELLSNTRAGGTT